MSHVVRCRAAVVVLGVALFATLGGQHMLGHPARAAAEAGRSPAAVAVGGWSGTITLTRKTEGTTPGPSGITFTGGLDQTLVITLNEDGTARASETFREEVYALKSGCGAMEGPHDVTTGTSDVQLRYYPQPIKYGDKFRIEIHIDPFQASRSFKGWIFTGEGCGGSATTGTRSVAQHTFTIEGDAPRGTMTLQGSTPPERIGSCGESASDVLPGSFLNWNNCGTETIAWNLTRSKKLEITKLELKDYDPKHNVPDNKGRVGLELAPLEYLSASSHAYFEHVTRIAGNVTVEGFRGDNLRIAALEVLENGNVVAEARPDPTQSALDPLLVSQLQPFVELFSDEDFSKPGGIASRESNPLFELSSYQFDDVDQKKDGTLTLRLRAESDWDGEVFSQPIEVEKLVLYDEPNRYLSRDESYGGDSWVRPSVKLALEHFASKFQRLAKKELLYGDMANMNGGRFAPHLDHEDGLDADAAYDGYFRKAPRGEGLCTEVYTIKVRKKIKKKVKKGKKDVFVWQSITVEEKRRREVPCERLVHVEAAFYLVNIFLNDPTYGSKIKNIFVTYNADPRSPAARTTRDRFFEAIRNVRLRDGRMARDVIKHAAGHDGHFHIRFKEP